MINPLQTAVLYTLSEGSEQWVLGCVSDFAE